MFLSRVSIKLILAVLSTLLVGGFVGATIIISDLGKLGCRQLISTAATNTQAACNEISQKYLLSRQQRAFNETTRASFEATLLQIVLDHYVGVEGGFWSSASGFTSYAYPTYDGSSRKTDVPTAEQAHIAEIAQKTLSAQRLTSDRAQGQREAIILTACPVSHETAVWLMERVHLTTSLTYEIVRMRIWMLFSFLGFLAVTLAALITVWTRQLYSVVNAIDSGENSQPENERGQNWEFERIAKAMRTSAERLRAAEAKADQQAEALARADRLRSVGEMTAGLAHDFREPLSTLRLKIENLGVDPEGRMPETIRVATEQVDRLDRFVEMILAMTRPFEIKIERVDLKNWIDQCFTTVRKHAFEKSVNLLFECEVATWMIDSFQLARALHNLIENAVFATPAGGSVFVRLFSENDELLMIDVRDSGHGIPESLRKRLFRDPHSNRPGGSGLGLRIAKEIIEAHHGRIDYIEALDQGAWFRMEIPDGTTDPRHRR